MVQGVASQKRRKSSSNPRQKISSTLRTIQPTTTSQTNNEGGKIRVQKVKKPNFTNAPQKYGYRNGAHGNGPLEAYTTNTYSNG